MAGETTQQGQQQTTEQSGQQGQQTQQTEEGKQTEQQQTQPDPFEVFANAGLSEEQLAFEFAELSGTPVEPLKQVQPTEQSQSTEPTKPAQSTEQPPAQQSTQAPAQAPAQTPPTDDAAARLAKLEEDNNALRQLVAQLSAGGVIPQTFPAQTQQPGQVPTQQGQTQQGQTQTTTTSQASQQTQTQTQQPQLFSYEDIPLMTQDELDECIDKPELIIKAVIKARNDALRQAETVLPRLVEVATNKQIMIAKAVTDFFDANRDLVPFSDFYRAELARQEQLTPTEKYSTIFENAAKELRTKLRLQVPTQPNGTQAQPGATQQGQQSQETTQQSPQGQAPGQTSLPPAFAATRQSSTGRPAQTETDQAVKDFYELAR